MKLRKFIVAIMCAFICSQGFAQTNAMDNELAVLTEKLAGRIKATAKKKVTVLDFTDLQSSSSEFGRYLAEQITLDLVSGDRNFSVLDRANLKSILAEHNLTAKGLVDPETAKQLGKFAGVDALILGTIVPMNDSIQITAKIITTDTAEIVGAGKASFQKSKEIQELLDRSFARGSETIDVSGTSSSSGREFNAPSTVQKFVNFNVELLSFRILPTENAFAAMQLVNTSKLVIAIAANSFTDPTYGGDHVSAKIVDENDHLVRCSKLEGLNIFHIFSSVSPQTGLGSILAGLPQNWQNYMTEVKPGESARFTVEFAPEKENNGEQKKVKLGNVFNLQVELITMVKNADDEKPIPKLDNFYLDRIIPTKRVNAEVAK
jgi:TolB-like protein